MRKIEFMKKEIEDLEERIANLWSLSIKLSYNTEIKIPIDSMDHIY